MLMKSLLQHPQIRALHQSVLESLAIRKDVRLLPAVDFHCEQHAFRKFSAQELKSCLRVKIVFSPLLVLASHSDSHSEKLVRAGKQQFVESGR